MTSAPVVVVAAGFRLRAGEGQAPLHRSDEVAARGTLRLHERRRFHRGDVTAGGLVGAGASPDIQYRPRIAERSPDPANA